MKISIKSPVSTAVATIFGIIVLSTYVLPLEGLRSDILAWVVIASAATLLVGTVNLFSVHLRKIQEASGSALYSFILLLSLFITFVITLIQGSDGKGSQWIFQYIQIPIESSLMAVTAVTLTYATSRILSRRTNLYSILFMIFTLMALMNNGSFFNLNLSFLQTIAGAGARGILLGVGLGTVATGIRVLIGADRPYGS